jgi:hypothetical protein
MGYRGERQILQVVVLECSGEGEQMIDAFTAEIGSDVAADEARRQ